VTLSAVLTLGASERCWRPGTARSLAVSEGQITIRYIDGPMDGKTRAVPSSGISDLPTHVAIRSSDPDPCSSGHRRHYMLAKDASTGDLSYLLDGAGTAVGRWHRASMTIDRRAQLDRIGRVGDRHGLVLVIESAFLSPRAVVDGALNRAQ
jgi:hypothetical protein